MTQSPAPSSASRCESSARADSLHPPEARQNDSHHAACPIVTFPHPAPPPPDSADSTARPPTPPATVPPHSDAAASSAPLAQAHSESFPPARDHPISPRAHPAPPPAS